MSSSRTSATYAASISAAALAAAVPAVYFALSAQCSDALGSFSGAQRELHKRTGTILSAHERGLAMVPFLVLILVLTLWAAASYLRWRAFWWAWRNAARLLAFLPRTMQQAIGFVCLVALAVLVLLVWFSAIVNAIAAAQSGDPMPVIGWTLVFGAISVLSYNLIALWCRGDEWPVPPTNRELSEPTRRVERCENQPDE